MKYYLDAREVEVIETDFEPGEGCYIVAACFVDDGTDLTDKQCYELQDKYQSELYQNAYEDAVCTAEDLFDAINDR